jgi:hypothetical protein
MMRLALALVAVLLSPAVIADTVFDAVPTSRVIATSTGAQRDVLSGAKQQELRVIISKVDGNYYWTTRDNVPLLLHRSGIFYLFVDPTGGGYVEIRDTHMETESLRPEGARFLYKEHLRSGMFGAFTYFGEAETFAP